LIDQLDDKDSFTECDGSLVCIRKCDEVDRKQNEMKTHIAQKVKGVENLALSRNDLVNQNKRLRDQRELFVLIVKSFD
jgi:hypothetical protein